MSTLKRSSLILGMIAVMLLVTVDEADAQRGNTRGGRPAHDERIDLTAMYGHMWGGNISSGVGRFRLGTAPSMFFALNYPLGKAFWVELSYGRQNGELNLDQSLQGTTKLSDMSINYWQIGSVRGLPVGEGNIIPYVAGTLGITYYSPEQDRFTVPGEPSGQEYALDSATKFSLTIGVGVKAFFGEAERFGIRASFKTMPTFYNTGAGLWFGSGGAGLTVGGSAIWQWEVAGGVTIRLG
jgi:hypothetical protein